MLFSLGFGDVLNSLLIIVVYSLLNRRDFEGNTIARTGEFVVGIVALIALIFGERG